MKTSLIAFILLLSSCIPSQKVAERRIAKYVDHYPSLITRDTITKIDTFTTKAIEISRDTILTRDTTYIEKNGARVKIVLRDTIEKEIPIYLEALCPPDTVIKEIKLPSNTINVRPKGKNYFWYIVIVAGILFGVLLFRK